MKDKTIAERFAEQYPVVKEPYIEGNLDKWKCEFYHWLQQQPENQADQAKTNEWQLITILRKLQDAGLPIVSSAYTNAYNEPSAFCFEKFTLALQDNKKWDISLREYYGKIAEGLTIDEAISKLKQLLGGGDE